MSEIAQEGIATTEDRKQDPGEQKEKQPTETQGSTDAICPICTLKYDITAYVPCGHSICYKCFLKIRKLCENKLNTSCPVCKDEAERPLIYSMAWFSRQTHYKTPEEMFIETSELYKKFRDEGKKFQLVCDSKWSTTYSAFIHRSASSMIAELDKIRCPFYRIQKNNELKGQTRDYTTVLTSEELIASAVFGKPISIKCTHETGDFGDFSLLKKHLMSEHGVTYCSVCMSKKPEFFIDQPLFDAHALKAHTETMHKKCVLCNKKLYDIDYLKQHLNTEHIRCELCRQFSNNDSYWKDDAEYKTHLAQAHYTCPVSHCKAVMASFATKADCAKHILSQHAESLSTEDKKKWKHIVAESRDVIDPEDGANVQKYSMAKRFGPKYAVNDIARVRSSSANDKLLTNEEEEKNIRSSLNRGSLHISETLPSRPKTDQEVIQELLGEDNMEINTNEAIQHTSLQRGSQKSKRKYIDINIADPESLERAQVAIAIQRSYRDGLQEKQAHEVYTATNKKQSSKQRNSGNNLENADSYMRPNQGLFDIQDANHDSFIDRIKYETSGLKSKPRKTEEQLQKEIEEKLKQEEERKKLLIEQKKNEIINEAAKNGIALEFKPNKKRRIQDNSQTTAKSTAKNSSNDDQVDQVRPKRKYEETPSQTASSISALKNLKFAKETPKIVLPAKGMNIKKTILTTKGKTFIKEMSTGYEIKQKREDINVIKQTHKHPIRNLNIQETQNIPKEERELMDIDNKIRLAKEEHDKNREIHKGDATDYIKIVAPLQKQRAEILRLIEANKKGVEKQKKINLLDTDARLRQRESSN